MSNLISKQTDNRFFTYHNDGLLDLFIGFAILFAGLFLWTEMVWMVAIFIPVLMPSFQAARNRFLQSRIGDLAQSPQGKAQNVKLFLYIIFLLGVLMLAGVGMFFAFDFMSGPINDWLRKYFLLVLGGVFASVWLFAAAILKIKRFYLYACFTFASLAAVQFAALPFWVAFIILGVVIVLSGLMILVRFNQRHPRVE